MRRGARILYATGILPTDDMTRRISRAHQSQAAARLSAQLCGADFNPTVQSRSHSRCVIAAAAGNIRAMRLGIDVEWMSPDRPIGAIARQFLSSAPERVTPVDFYRGWTFYEAYYKAFGSFPPEAAILEAVAHTEDGVPFRLSDGTDVMQQFAADAFRLCLVWRCEGSEFAVLERRQPADQ